MEKNCVWVSANAAFLPGKRDLKGNRVDDSPPACHALFGTGLEQAVMCPDIGWHWSYPTPLSAARVLPELSTTCQYLSSYQETVWTQTLLTTWFCPLGLWGLSSLQLEGLPQVLPCIDADSGTSPFLFILSEVHHWPEGKQQPGRLVDPTGAAEAAWASSLLAWPEPSVSTRAASIQRQAGPKAQPRGSDTVFKAKS